MPPVPLLESLVFRLRREPLVSLVLLYTTQRQSNHLKVLPELLAQASKVRVRPALLVLKVPKAKLAQPVPRARPAPLDRPRVSKAKLASTDRPLASKARLPDKLLVFRGRLVFRDRLARQVRQDPSRSL
jgi:hypothetical protein